MLPSSPCGNKTNILLQSVPVRRTPVLAIGAEPIPVNPDETFRYRNFLS
jgi:hypothetical protein